MRCLIYIDGGSRGNPGPAAYAFIIKTERGDIREASFIGLATNNVAEYSALLAALRKAKALGCSSIVIHADSRLLVKQMIGEYRVRSSSLSRLYEEAKRLEREFGKVEYVYIPREINKEADRLAGRILEERIEREYGGS